MLKLKKDTTEKKKAVETKGATVQITVVGVTHQFLERLKKAGNAMGKYGSVTVKVDGT